MEGQDILKPFKGQVKSDSSGGDSETELLGRTNSGATASSSLSYIFIPESHGLASNTPVSSLLADSFLTLRCEVVCANVVKSGSSTFAVYSISVTDVENKSWSIKRRFRHFEELHRRLKEYPEYTFHLPPKHFLSTGLDVPVIRERCKLLDAYLKKLLQLPTISGSIEVWHFLSVDSQTYSFSDSISIIETLSGMMTKLERVRVMKIVKRLNVMLILWPDGIFLTKHPKRQRPTPSASSHNSPNGQPPAPLSSPKEDDIRRLDELQEKEARRREQFIYELMIAALVGLVGRKEYDHCAKDLYYFLQSPVCLKQLAFGLLELLLLSAFPELENIFRQLIEEKDKFGELQQS